MSTPSFPTERGVLMSYEILYDRKFIRTTRGIIPMILSGSNNCTEQMWSRSGRSYERRERHWWAWIPKSLPVMDNTETDYLNKIASICEGNDPDRELFRWNGNWLTYGQWLRWFKNGCSASATIEEYLSQNRTQSFVGHIRIYTEEAWVQRELEEYIHTTAKLESWLDRANERVKQISAEQQNALDVYICLSFSGNEALKVRSRSVEGEVVAKRRDAFLKDYQKGKWMMFTRDPAEAKVFPSIDVALEELGSGAESVRFVKAKKQLRPKNFAIRILHGNLSGHYIMRKTKNHLFPAYSIKEAKRFPSHEAAISFAKETRKRGFRIGDTVVVVNQADNTEETVCIGEEAS